MEAQIETSSLTAPPTTTRLYEAVTMGDIASFEELVRQDPLIIDRCVIENASSCCFQPPLLLHVAAEKGHLEMVKALLELRPSMCLTHDRDGRSPSHVAAIQGHVDVLKMLHEANPHAAQERTSSGDTILHVAVDTGHLEMLHPSMCLALDRDVRNPVHLASIRGHVRVLEVLHKANPHAAQERTSSGDTILHLCIKYNQLQALKTLLKLTEDDGNQLLNSKDSNGNTALHLATTAKQPEMVDHLLNQRGMEKNAINKNNMTAVDIQVMQNRKELGNAQIAQYLKREKAKEAKEALNQQADEIWLKEQRTSIMLVASLIAAAAFQVGINPPGGVWQEDKKTSGVAPAPQVAGDSVWSSKGYVEYNVILVCNSLALVSSLSVIFLLISGLPCKRHFLSILRITLWITVTATTLTYLISIQRLTSDDADWHPLVWISFCSLTSWQVLVGVIFVGNTVRLILKCLGWTGKESIRRFGNKWFSRLFSNNTTTTTTTNDCNA